MDNVIFDTARESKKAPNQGDRIIMASADDIIRDEDVNPFIEETDINNEQYDIELAELADMFNLNAQSL